MKYFKGALIASLLAVTAVGMWIGDDIIAAKLVQDNSQFAEDACGPRGVKSVSVSGFECREV
ncbi:hypothetical protein [Salinibius halmophilus]|uniref:hypothetical protein n=1 Tax=Salinibius halmophilus TaxID=1853216 RepID=UPI000E661ED3|nr:hypothetical protein [Salinibius halmophilus]